MTLRRRGPFAAIALVAALAGCSGGPSSKSEVPSEGPPDVRIDVVRRHVEQFRQDLSRRPAGSQEERIAATYILGHLQRAGYVVRLEDVPIADLVASSDVIALPPDGGDPAVVVTVGYDTPDSGAGNDVGIGLFLELARALRARIADHGVEFVALGAESADVGDGRLGSLRLARLLLDEELDPIVVEIGPIALEDRSVDVSGALAGEFRRAARAAGVSIDGPAGIEEPDVFATAGFRTVAVGGGARPAGRLLLRWLSDAGD